MDGVQTANDSGGGWVNGPQSCTVWQRSQPAVYQLGCFIIANGLLVPPTVGVYQSVWLRICLCLGLFCHVLWAGPARCWPDGLFWQLAAFLANVAHLAYLGYVTYPVAFDEDVRRVYDALFKPFRVSRQQFRVMLDSGGDIYELDRTGHYATEGRTRTDLALSLLISGRMRVTSKGSFLHHIYPSQFMDSLEWQGIRSSSGPSTFQVTVTADSDCRYIQWQRKPLDKFLRKEGFMRAVFETTVGKDITTKLYSINDESEYLPPPTAGTNAAGDRAAAKAPGGKPRPALAQRTSVPEIGQICPPDDEDEDEEDRGLLSHKWERALSVDEGSGGIAQQQHHHHHHQHQQQPAGAGGGMSQLGVPGHSGSTQSLHSVRSMVDIRASIASGRGADVAGGRSSLAPGDRSPARSSGLMVAAPSHASEPVLINSSSERTCTPVESSSIL